VDDQLTLETIADVLDAHQDIMEEILHGCEQMMCTLKILRERVERLEERDLT